MWLVLTAAAQAAGCGDRLASDPTGAGATSLAACLEAADLVHLGALAYATAAGGSGDARPLALARLVAYAERTGDVGPLRRAAGTGEVDLVASWWLTLSTPYTLETAEIEGVSGKRSASMLDYSRRSWLANAELRYKSEVLYERQVILWDGGGTAPAAWTWISDAKDRALLDVAQVYFDIERHDNAATYARMCDRRSGAVHLAFDVLAVAVGLGGPPQPDKKEAIDRKGWRPTLDDDWPFAPATQLALAARGMQVGDTGTRAQDHLERFDRDAGDLRAALILAERAAGWDAWLAMTPSLQADLRQRTPIGAAVARREGLERELGATRKQGVEAWAAEAVAAEYARIDAELAAEILPALRRRAALVGELEDEAAALREGKIARISLTSLSSLGDYGFWPGTPRQISPSGFASGE